MKSPNIYEIYYDEEADFLEVYFGYPTESKAEEIEEGIFIRRDKDTNEVKSIEILAFKKKGIKILNEVLKQYDKKLPIKISI